ncbi:hypothetical protein ABZP36_030057 [Zizania latifolia]
MRGIIFTFSCFLYLGRSHPHRLSCQQCLHRFLGLNDALKSASIQDERCLEVAKKYYQRAGVAHKVDVKHALAADSLKSLIDHGEANSYDFAFVDADKRMYEEYYELLLKLVRVGGLIVIDNVLWYGRVADPLKLLEDNRINISMVPIGDGMTICRKLVDT